MSTAYRHLLLAVLALFTVAFAMRAEAGFSSVWSFAGVGSDKAPLRVSVDSVKEQTADAPIAFSCEIVSKRRFHQSLVRFQVVDATGTAVSEDALIIDLTAGANACAFQWDAQDAVPGHYAARVEVHYAPGANAAAYDWEMLRVDADNLAERLEASEERIAALRDAVAEEHPHLALRLGLAEHAAKEARRASGEGAWKTFANYVPYIESAAQRIFDDMLLGGARERVGEAPNLEKPVLNGQSFSAGERPVYLFGRVLEEASPDALAELGGLGLNFAVVELSPADTLSGPGKTRAYEKRFEAFFKAAEQAGVAVSVQLAPHKTGGWPLDMWPEIAERGAKEMSLPGMMELFQWHAASVLPYLAKQPMVHSIGVLDAPRFRFDSETVRRAFVEHIERLYPERYTLNRAWHTHLSSFGDIGIWGDYRGYYDDILLAEGAEETRYQDRRAYQFNWQRFHITLSNRLLDEVHDFVAARSKKVHYVTLPGTAFEAGESRNGIDRKYLASRFETSACKLTVRLDDPVFAMEFPEPAAACALLRSMAPEHPVLLTSLDFQFGAGRQDQREYGFISTLLWETALAGVSATALAPDTELFAHPRALEAFAVTARDINRLAPIVQAFQRNLPPIAVLFSESSRIFDDGVPHLQSCLYAFEGCSFGGYGARFITEEQCANGGLDSVKVLVIPETPALSDAAFDAIAAYLGAGGTIARAGKPILYDERGDSRAGVLPNTGNTVLVRGMNLPTEYLHAIDAAIVLGALPAVARPVNPHGYPLEGVSTRYIEHEGAAYLYAVNLRKEAVVCHLTGSARAGTDLLGGSEVTFPMLMEPLRPMLVRLHGPAAQLHAAGQ